LFYRTEKVLVHNFYNSFQKNSVDFTKQLLWDVNKSMIDQVVSSPDNVALLKRLLKDPLVEEEKANPDDGKIVPL
jgi:hypothetical protein